MQEFIDSELSRILEYEIDPFKMLRYKGVDIRADMYVWAFYQALEKFTLSNNVRLIDTVYNMATGRKDLKCTGAIELNLDKKIMRTRNGTFNYYKDTAKFNQFLDDFHTRHDNCDFGVISFGLYGYELAHENIIFVYKNPYVGITMTIYEPAGSMTSTTDTETNNFLQYFATSYGLRFNIPTYVLPRTSISCYMGLQSVVDNAGLDIGYCVMYSYLWAYMAIRCIINLKPSWLDRLYAKYSDKKYVNISSILKSVEQDIKVSTLANTPEKLHSVVFNFAVLVMNEHTLDISKFSRKGAEQFEKLFQKSLSEVINS
jgi:hypothetical protein